MALGGTGTLVTERASQTNAGTFSISDTTAGGGKGGSDGGTVVLGGSTGRGGRPDTGTGIAVGTSHTLGYVGIITLGTDEVTGELTELGTGGFRGDVLSTSGGRAVVGHQVTVGHVGPDTAARVVVGTGTADGVGGDLVPTNVTVEGTGTFHGHSGATIRGTLGSLGAAVVLDGVAATSPGVSLVIPSNAASETQRAITGGTVEGRAGGACHLNTSRGITNGTGTTRGEHTRGGGGFVTEDILRVGLVTRVTVEGTLLVDVGGITTIGGVGDGDRRAVIHDLAARRGGLVSTRGGTGHSTSGRVVGSVTEITSEGTSITCNTRAAHGGDLTSDSGGSAQVGDGVTLRSGDPLTRPSSVALALDLSLGGLVTIFARERLVAKNDGTTQTSVGPGDRDGRAVVGDSRASGGGAPGTRGGGIGGTDGAVGGVTLTTGETTAGTQDSRITASILPRSLFSRRISGTVASNLGASRSRGEGAGGGAGHITDGFIPGRASGSTDTTNGGIITLAVRAEVRDESTAGGGTP